VEQINPSDGFDPLMKSGPSQGAVQRKLQKNARIDKSEDLVHERLLYILNAHVP